ncbi:MAG: hypothetical protein KDJ99_08710, partial [Candidatus Competibacteraceae bacterium]|nr:hypothetical protein [Candidatus Competibacteraceae bacterium]
MRQAEELTGISNQQVSRWRKRLQDAEKYKSILYGATIRKSSGPVLEIQSIVKLWLCRALAGFAFARACGARA